MTDSKPLGDLLPFRMPEWTEEQWAAHEERVAKIQGEEIRQATERAESDRRRRMLEAGFPARAVEVARLADETSPAIVRVKSWDPDKACVLVLSGPKGCGKTVAAAWWALRRSWPPVFLRSTTFAASSRYDTEKRDAWFKASALVLDDLGTEYADQKGNYLVDLDELVDVFYGDMRPLVITTNCTRERFAERYGGRIMDRLREAGAWFSMSGESRRGQR
jgi:DNA replication protein DnaC